MYAAVGRGQLFCVAGAAWPRFLQVALYLFFVLRLGQAAGARMLFSVGGYGGFFDFDARLPLAAAVDVVALVNLLQVSVRSNAVMCGVVDGCAGFVINNQKFAFAVDFGCAHVIIG